MMITMTPELAKATVREHVLTFSKHLYSEIVSLHEWFTIYKEAIALHEALAMVEAFWWMDCPYESDQTRACFDPKLVMRMLDTREPCRRCEGFANAQDTVDRLIKELT